ncbi:MAG TPA: sensor histidine kinase [Myxococcota bacterium]|nr:sensor histidine kinase [Myxococcota bacterium]
MTPDLTHLHRAELLLVKLRALGMASWVLILQHATFTASPARVYAVLGLGIAYSAASYLYVRRGRAVRAGAIATTLGDGAIVAAICACTGGIASDFYPYFYLTSIATSIRFGAAPAFAVFAVQSLWSATLYLWAPPLPGSDPSWGALLLRVFYLLFAALLGTALSRDARENLEAARLARDRARGLLRRLIHAEEEERKRIASDLHDRMGARFFELSYGIDRARGAVGDDKPEAIQHLERLASDARACGDEIRELMNQLRPTVLDDFGVSEALREWGMNLQAQCELRVRLEIDPEASAARPDVNVALFRIAQEAVLNARKHAEASELEIALARDASGERIVLSVRDDGCGFDARAPTRGRFGMLGMRERAEACGGRLEVSSAPGRGTRLRAIAPAGPGA